MTWRYLSWSERGTEPIWQYRCTWRNQGDFVTFFFSIYKLHRFSFPETFIFYIAAIAAAWLCAFITYIQQLDFFTVTHWSLRSLSRKVSKTCWGSTVPVRNFWYRLSVSCAAELLTKWFHRRSLYICKRWFTQPWRQQTLKTVECNTGKIMLWY